MSIFHLNWWRAQLQSLFQRTGSLGLWVYGNRIKYLGIIYWKINQGVQPVYSFTFNVLFYSDGFSISYHRTSQISQAFQ